jgi:thiol-disulfide isomerase/thioredoxin
MGAPDDTERLAPADLGGPLGERATLVQFSSAFCAPCRATRRVLADVSGMVEGVRHVEIDAEAHLGLVRRLRIERTPTVLVLDAGGAVVRRAAGAPRRADVIAALGAAVPAPAEGPSGGADVGQVTAADLAKGRRGLCTGE